MKQRYSMALHNRGIRTFLLLIFVIISTSTALLSLNMLGRSYTYNVGDIARESIRVPWEIVYPIQFETEQEKRFAAENIPPLFDKDPYILSEKTKLVNILFNTIETVITTYPAASREDTQNQLKMVMDSLPDQIRFDRRIVYAVLSYSRIEELRRTVITILNDLYEKGILEEGSFPSMQSGSVVVVKTQTDESSYIEEKRKIDELY
ncbi:MAG: hypothetical protein ACRCUT_00760, partial [Spirochaetota bacterium]